MQLTTLNGKGAACDLFDVSMGINYRKFTSGNIGHTSLVKGSFTMVKSSV